MPVEMNVFIFVELAVVVITLSHCTSRASLCMFRASTPWHNHGGSQITTPNPYTYFLPVFCIITWKNEATRVLLQVEYYDW